MDGAPFRPLGNELGLSPSQTYARVVEELQQLPNNTQLTQHYSNRWSGILNVDGKYIKIKGFKKKIPFIWSVDFLQHDFPVGLLAPAESIVAFSQFFLMLKNCHYPLRIVIADDVSPLRIALKRYYPEATVQLCHTHYLENIRQQLHIRTDERYQPFFYDLVNTVFPRTVFQMEREQELLRLFQQYATDNELLRYILTDIHLRQPELFAYQAFPQCPHTNNMIECFNSHLNARLKSIKGFQSFVSAERFLNGYLIRRRTKPFTDCDAPFQHYNGQMPLQNSIDLGKTWPDILGIKTPKL